MIPVILSGGSGTRLWPLSREMNPKQLLKLTGEQTMLQKTILRLGAQKRPIIVCNEAHRFMVAEQLRQIEVKSHSIILEPIGRNTAPAVALAAFQAMSTEEDPILMVLPADHEIRNESALQEAIGIAEHFASKGHLMTFGIVPDKAETGYGYIKTKAEHAGSGASPVEKFVEKPNKETAQKYIDSQNYYWNSGMFMFKASVYIEELRAFAPDIYASCKCAYEGMNQDFDFTRLDEDCFAACRSDSIDYAVMERTERAMVVPLDAGWSDVGSWDALWQIGEQNADRNVVCGDVLTRDTHDCYLHSSGRLLTTIGLNQHVVVETADAVLVADKRCVQDVKNIVDQLKEGNRKEANLHRKVNRPWGTYEIIDAADLFLVKRIVVNPGASLSLQMHRHRAEHWVVVSGVAKVTCGDNVSILTENKSTYIPLGEKHRLENTKQIPLEIIEVQSGNYLGEDDIIRFEDNYNRGL